jgi:hypothetical protein
MQAKQSSTAASRQPAAGGEGGRWAGPGANAGGGGELPYRVYAVAGAGLAAAHVGTVVAKAMRGGQSE